MPELPEVEIARKNLERALKGKKIARVLAPKDDPIVFDKQNAAAIQKALKSAKIIGSGRKGKYFWLKLDRRPWVVIHLGMTGNIEIRRKKDKRGWDGGMLYASPHKKDPLSELPRFCRLFIEASDGTQVAYTDPRRFGRIRLAQDPLSEPPISRLGFDPMAGVPPVSELTKILAKRKAPIKAVLLDQSVFAGVGNWIADEVLYQSRLSPHRLANQLNKIELGRLRTRLIAIIKKAVAVEADYKRYPNIWLFQHRWEKGKLSHTSRGYEIRHDTVGGRTTAWVPDLQT